MENNLNNTASFDDIVFEDRNKLFGAYQLRRDYIRNFIIAISVSAVAVTAFFVIYSFILSLPEKQLEEQEVIVDAIIEDIPLDPETPEPPELVIPPPQVEMIRFLPPEIKPDNEVKVEDIPPTQDKLDSVANIGNKNQDGDANQVIIEDNTANKIVDNGDDDKVYFNVEEGAEFPGGGFSAMSKFVQKNLVYPKKSERAGTEGKVFVYFEVDKEGNIVNVKITKGINEELDAEAMRVIKAMPKWKPAKQNGKNVRQRQTVPITYKLPE